MARGALGSDFLFHERNGTRAHGKAAALGARRCYLRARPATNPDRQGAPRGGTAVYYKRALYCCPIDIPPSSREMEALAESLHFDIVTPLTSTYYPNKINCRSDILDIAFMKGVALKLGCIGPLQWLNSDHRSVLMRLGSLIADCPPSIKTITNWQKVSAALEEIDTPILNSILNDTVSTDDIDNAIGALTNHITTVVESSSKTVPAKSDPESCLEMLSN
ncbi:hypothetical protein EVAR_37548_1 [Eumeta japonica]|uniref:Uncharacterized protein n=1 Tax=Eumeta variegata TaxID=151549 RepID=A0A4C1XQ72_EUMVA|nr:hypothetical protein EVAR_37548_1 [Eumeta japonica]